ncbi:MAG: translation initiation factor eIF-1A [archaeon]
MEFRRKPRPNPNLGLSEEEVFAKIRLPYRKEGEQFAVCMQMLGSDKIKARCEDGIERICRIPGKMRKRVWIRQNDLIVVKLWDFQPIKADVTWRYLPTQGFHLKRKNLLNDNVKDFGEQRGQ